MILLTGSNGLVGKTLVKRLAQKKLPVRAMDTDKPKELPEGVQFIQSDLLDEDTLKKACSGVDAIIHMMDIKGTNHITRRSMKKANVRGTANLLMAAKKAGIRRFFFLSTYEIYGKTEKIPIRIDERKKPVTRYGRDKFKAEKLCLVAAEKGDIDLTIFRPALILGPGTKNPTILLTLYMAMGMDDANRLYIAGNGETKFQLLHPDDAVEAFMLAYAKDISKGKIYNLGSDRVQTQIEQLVQIKKEARLDCSIRHLSTFKTAVMSLLLKPFKLHYLNRQHIYYLTRNLILDCQSVKNDLGWVPKRENTDIIMETIRWYREEKLD